ncbi:MAG: phage tail tape measure protein [Thermoguttaceae bacterium]|nr:phage tail tape measure protein [Thermoguttaceae bacterium]
MASAQGIRAGAAFVELFADDRRLVRGLKAASAKLKAWGQSVTTMGKRFMAAGAAIIAPLAAAAKTFASMGDEVQKMSLRTGVSAESLSELGFAAEQSGSDLATLEVGLRKMQRSIGDAADGSQTAVDALAALGLSVGRLIGLSPEEQFKLIADRIAGIPDPTMRAAAAMELFGRSGTQLLPIMQAGAAGIEALQKQARDLGLTISGEDANAAAALSDAMNVLWRVFKQGVFVIGSALAPVLKDFAERAAGVIKSVSDWIKQNKDVVVTVFKVAAAVAAGGAALMVLGGLISGVGFAFGTLASIVAGVGTALGVIGTVLGAILSPVGLVIAALASLGGYLLYVSGAGQQALSWLGQQFAALRDTALAAWKGISDALAAGDIGLAAQILWLTLKMEWQKGVAWLTDKWIGFKETFMAVATEAVYGTAKILTSAWAGLQTAWVETVAFMSKAWTVFTSSLVTGWRTAQNWIAKKFVSLMAMFDDSVDVEATQQILDEDFQREQRGRDQATQQQLRDIETTRQAKRKAIDQEEQGTLDELNREKDARHVARKKQYDAEVQAAEDAVAQARKQWQDALDEAARKRAEVAETTGPERIKGPGDLEGLDLEGIGKKSISVQGTFNAMAAQGLGTGGPMERAARAGEETAKNTRKLVMQAQHGGLQFA